MAVLQKVIIKAFKGIVHPKIEMYEFLSSTENKKCW